MSFPVDLAEMTLSGGAADADDQTDPWVIPSELPPWLPSPPTSPAPSPSPSPPSGGGGGGGGLPQLPGVYTDEDVQRAYERGRAEEAAKMVKQTAIAAVVSGLVSYALARALP